MNDAALIGVAEPLGVRPEDWPALIAALDGGDWVAALAIARRLRSVLADVEDHTVAIARREGHTWAEIGEVASCSRQVAHRRWGATAA